MRVRPLTALTLSLAAALAACDGDSTAPQPPPEVSVVFLDNARRLNTVRTGGEPALTGLQGIVPVAAAGGKLAFFAPRVTETSGGHSVVVDSGGLRLYHVADGRVDTLGVPLTSANTPGAISPDGRTIVYARVASDSVWLVVVRLDSAARDSANLSAHVEDSPAAEQAIFSTPAFSPDGEQVAFLLPNLVGMQLMLYELRTKRVVVFPVRVPTSTRYAPLKGWPRWTRDGSIRFLVRERSTPQRLSDTLAVLQVFPRIPEQHAVVAFRGAAPPDLSMSVADIYSFDESGTAVAFAMVANEQAGVFLMRRGAGVFEQMVYAPGVTPVLPLLVP